MSKIDTSQIHNSGIIKKGEEIVENTGSTMKLKFPKILLDIPVYYYRLRKLKKK